MHRQATEVERRGLAGSSDAKIPLLFGIHKFFEGKLAKITKKLSHLPQPEHGPSVRRNRPPAQEQIKFPTIFPLPPFGANAMRICTKRDMRLSQTQSFPLLYSHFEKPIIPVSKTNYPNIENQKFQLLGLLVFDIGNIVICSWEHLILCTTSPLPHRSLLTP